MIDTAFTRLVGCSAPIQLAPMPGVSTVELAAAVADAGGLGMVGTPLLPPVVLGGILDQLAARTRGAFGAGFLMPFLDRACVEVAARKARVVEFFFGDPDPELVRVARSAGALVGWQAGSVAEAVRAEQAGCDFVVAQGTEAGGHVRSRSSLLPLLAGVLDAVKVPVVAAGGIATARDLAAVLACGAGGARLGTRFVASAESGAHPAYVQALLGATAEETCLTEAFSVMWPGAPHRVLRSAVAAAEALKQEVIGETHMGGQAIPVPRLSVLCPLRGTTGELPAMALYAGESVTNVNHVEPAGEIVSGLVAGAERLLRERAGEIR